MTWASTDRRLFLLAIYRARKEPVFRGGLLESLSPQRDTTWINNVEWGN
jgi:hypothetical protein